MLQPLPQVIPTSVHLVKGGLVGAAGGGDLNEWLPLD